MDTILRTTVQKRNSLHFLLDDLQVWACCMDAEDDRPFGVRLKWLEHKYSCSPLNHITVDGGNTYQRFESFIMPNGTIDMRMNERELDPERLDRLQKILVAYQKNLDAKVSSA